MTTVAAVDLGAESGRVLSVELADDGLRLSEWHRFPTPVGRDESGTLRWGLGQLQRHIAHGLAAVGEHTAVGSVGVDTWGIDFGLLDEDGRLLAQGRGLERGQPGPMSYLVRQNDTILLEDGWPTPDDLGRLVILPGGEAGILKAWWHADDHSEWRWQVEFYNHT